MSGGGGIADNGSLSGGGGGGIITILYDTAQLGGSMVAYGGAGHESGAAGLIYLDHNDILPYRKVRSIVIMINYVQ